jgi:hypothetical protein
VISVSVAPLTTSVSVGKSQQFTATVSGSSNSAVTWSVTGGASDGTITNSGLYTAPATAPNPAQVSVRATAQADATKSASATVTVTTTATAASGSVNVSPSTATVANFGMQQFTASLNGSPSSAVTWQVNGIVGGSKSFGFISASGLYVAPNGVPTKSDGKGSSITTTLIVSAVSQANGSASGTATVTVAPLNQNPESGAIRLGTSGGNANDSSTSGRMITCCGGTLGSLVARGGKQYILSNTHVLARSDLAQPNDAITEPGLIDTGTCTTSGARTVGNLSAFYNLESGPSPKIDAAIAQVVPGAVDPGGNILYLGATADGNGVPVPGAPHAGSGLTANVGMPVAKSGRSTGLTCSTVMAVNVNVSTQYQKGCGTGTNFSVNYADQVDVAGGAFSAEGDSGSLIVTQDAADPVALLYAGSDTDTVGNPVGPVLNFFASEGNKVTFVGGDAHPVFGCSLPNKPASAISASAVAVPSDAIQRAAAVRDVHAPELQGHPEVQAVGVGRSFDNPREAAILLFVTKGQQRSNIPAQIDGIRTRIVEGDLFSRRGIVSAEDSAVNEQSGGAPQQVSSISATEFARAKAVHAAHVDELMQETGVQGVGITSSIDAPGEAALMIFVVRGEAHNAIPSVIDGLRTRVRESSRFRAGFGDREPRRACHVPAHEK